jgi:hypothetical protein
VNSHLFSILLSGVPFVATILFALAGFVLFFTRNRTFAEASAFAVMAVLMGWSLVRQIALLADLPWLEQVVQWALTVMGPFLLYWKKEQLRRALVPLNDFIRDQMATSLLFCSGGLALIISVFFFSSGSEWQTAAPCLLPSSRWPVLNHWVLSYPQPITVAGEGRLLMILAYVGIGFSTYAMARRYAWPRTAVTVTAVVLTMPRLVVLALSPQEEIIQAAASAFVLLLLFRLVEEPTSEDLLLLPLAIVFTLSSYPLSMAVPPLFLALACVLLLRRHGLSPWWPLLRKNLLWGLPLLLVLLVFSQVPLVIAHYHHEAEVPQSLFESLFCPVMPFNHEPLLGTLANAVRYLLAGTQISYPLDDVINQAAGISPGGILTGIYHKLFKPLFVESQFNAAFHLPSRPPAATPWFGLLGFWLILPSLVYSLRHGPRRLRAIATAMWGYFYLAALIPAWTSDSVRNLTFFFVCSGFSIAFFLPPWRFSRRGRTVLLLLCGAIFINTWLGLLVRSAAATHPSLFGL